jgi:hypothetical protein
MAQFFNHHSFAIMALALWGGLAVLLLRDGVTRRDVFALAVLGAAFGVAWLILRPGRATFDETAQAEAAVGHGQPALVEFYSDY